MQPQPGTLEMANDKKLILKHLVIPAGAMRQNNERHVF